MTLKELADAILALPLAEQHQPAVVWPPEGCPAAKPVPVTGLASSPNESLIKSPVISTGKAPA